MYKQMTEEELVEEHIRLRDECGIDKIVEAAEELLMASKARKYLPKGLSTNGISERDRREYKALRRLSDVQLEYANQLVRKRWDEEQEKSLSRDEAYVNKLAGRELEDGWWEA